MESAALYYRKQVKRSGRKARFAPGIMLVVILGAADHELAPEKLLVMQFLHGALGFFGGLHLHECEAFGTLRLFMADDFRRHDLADAIEKFREVALGGVERKIADVKTRRGYLDGFRLACATPFTGGGPVADRRRLFAIIGLGTCSFDWLRGGGSGSLSAAKERLKALKERKRRLGGGTFVAAFRRGASGSPLRAAPGPAARALTRLGALLMRLHA